MLNSSESIWLMDGKRKKMVSKVQFVKKSHFLEGLFDVTALTFFIQKFVFKNLEIKYKEFFSIMVTS